MNPKRPMHRLRERLLSEHRRQDRGQSVAIAEFIVGLIAGAVLFWIFVDKVGSELHAKDTAAVSGTTWQNGTDWLWIIGQNLPMIFLGIGVFGLLTYAVYAREVR
jgi:hypothetical protein